jgi:hypothetical protein
MKKIIICTILAACFFSSCKKVTDVSNYASITDATAFETADRCLLALNGVYDAAQSGPYAGGTERRGYPFGAANIEQGDCRGEDVINIAAFYQITYQATYNGTAANCVAMWDQSYSMINKINVSIAGFKGAGSKGVLTAAVATQYEAECRFLRAMAHNELVIHFARPYLDGNGDKLGIPYRDFAVNSGSAVDQIRTIARGTVAQDYQKILADLDFAEANLPALQSGAAAVSTYRATKAAAIALKMRVKLAMGDWAGVITEGNKLVPATAPFVSPIGAWTLTATADGPFSAAGGLNASKENMFSVKNDPLDAPSVNGSLPGQFGPANLGGRGLVALSPIIWNNSGWLCDDKRRTLLYATGTNANNSQSILTIKYKDYTTRGDYSPQIRYAEVLLVLAEAEARQAATVSTRAIDLLNAVRNRALATPATQAYTAASFADKVALIKAILLERRIEFLFEGKRWSDISRLANDANYTTGGIPAKAANGSAGLAIYACGTAYTPGQAAIPYADFRFVWPIPTDEVTQNPIIVQNPGY